MDEVQHADWALCSYFELKQWALVHLVRRVSPDDLYRVMDEAPRLIGLNLYDYEPESEGWSGRTYTMQSIFSARYGGEPRALANLDSVHRWFIKALRTINGDVISFSAARKPLVGVTNRMPCTYTFPTTVEVCIKVAVLNFDNDGSAASYRTAARIGVLRPI